MYYIFIETVFNFSIVSRNLIRYEYLIGKMIYWNYDGVCCFINVIKQKKKNAIIFSEGRLMVVSPRALEYKKFRPWQEKTRLYTRGKRVGTTDSVRDTKKRIRLCLDRVRSNSAWKQKSLRGRIVTHSNRVLTHIRVVCTDVERTISAVNTRCSVCVYVWGRKKKQKNARENNNESPAQWWPF